MRRENLILKNIYEERTEKVRSSRLKAPLWITPSVAVEIFTPHKARAQDDRLKNSFDDISRVDLQAT